MICPINTRARDISVVKARACKVLDIFYFAINLCKRECLDDDGRVAVQRRSANKTTFPPCIFAGDNTVKIRSFRLENLLNAIQSMSRLWCVLAGHPIHFRSRVELAEMRMHRGDASRVREYTRGIKNPMKQMVYASLAAEIAAESTSWIFQCSICIERPEMTSVCTRPPLINLIIARWSLFDNSGLMPVLVRCEEPHSADSAPPTFH